MAVAATASLATRIGTLLEQVGGHVARQLRTFVKAAPDDSDDRVQQLLQQVDLSGLAFIATATQTEARQIAEVAGLDVLAQFGVSNNSALVNQVSQGAVSYAKDRAAYLVGKSLDADGALIDNPKAEYAITEATRDMLRSLISDYLERAAPMPDLASAIEKDFAFSAARAHNIAAYEVGTANSAGALTGLKVARSAGVDIKKYWSVNNLGTCCDECEENEEAGPIPLDEPFPSGDDAPLAHPGCQCVLLSAVASDDDSGDGDGED